MRRLLLALALLTVMLCPLGGCGKRGPPEPPGPASDITYPKVYPTR
jgi:predicted small lipoprotein YifL